jgi:hypothetical protein
VDQKLIFFDKALQTLDGQDLMRYDLRSQAIDFIITNDAINTENKYIPVKHFYIDFRTAILKPKLEMLIGGNVNHHSTSDISLTDNHGFSLYNVAHLIKIMNMAYGNEIG